MRPWSRNQSKVVVCGVDESPSGTDDPLRVREAFVALNCAKLVMINDLVWSAFAHRRAPDRSDRVCRPSMVP